jgi:hypothetical protein
MHTSFSLQKAEEKRSFGRPWRKWERNIKTDLKIAWKVMGWIRLV